MVGVGIKNLSELNLHLPLPSTHNAHTHTLQSSIMFAYQCVEKLYATFEGLNLQLTVLENHFESTFRPHTEAPVEVRCRHYMCFWCYCDCGSLQ